MLILCFADVHSHPLIMAGLERAAKKVDALCCGGDLLDAFKDIPYQIHVWHEWFKDVAKPAALCGGNHDYLTGALSIPPHQLADVPVRRLELLAPYFAAKLWVHGLPLADGSATFPGTSMLRAVGEEFLITSIPYESSKEDHFWAEGKRQHRSNLPWMVLRHEPPATCTLSEPTTGSTQAKRFVGLYQPDFLLCGHIHSAPFSSKTCWCRLGQTIGVNPGQKEDFVSYALLDTKTRKVEWVVEPW